MGGQKRRWNDVILGDLKKCELYSNWCVLAQDRSTWRGRVNTAVEDVNEEMEAAERNKKDEIKQRREATSQGQAQSVWRCSKHGCYFVWRSKAGLVNNVRQKHSRAAQCQWSFPHCGKLPRKQGFPMHVRFCKDNPNRRLT